MLLALLLHLLIFHLLTARDVPARKDTNFVVKHIDKCPNVGYYFKRDTPPNSVGPGVCYLCFCQGDHTAICWKRENRRCDKLSFRHPEIGTQDSRKRRSPGFADLFFREASKDFFNKNEEPQCKPFESTFSEDCPPVDWCIGCTVCDCNADGRWNCHVLSFCPDEKKQNKKKKKGPRRMYPNTPLVTPRTSTRKITEQPKPKPVKKNKPPVKPKNKSPVKPKNKTPAMVKRGGNNKTQPQRRIIRRPLPRMKMNLTTTPVKRRTPIRYKRISPGKAAVAKKIIKKNVVTHKPIEIKTTKSNLEMVLAQKLMQKVMGKLRKSVTAELKNMSAIAVDMVKREQMKNFRKATLKQNGKLNQAKKNQKKNPVKKPMYKPGKPPTNTTRNYLRNKREVTTVAISVVPVNSTKEYFLDVPNVTVPLPMTRMPSNLVFPDNDTHIVGSSTLPENEYYKYFVGNEEHKTKGNVALWDTGTTHVNITETVFDLIGAPLTSYASTEKGFIMSNNTKMITNFTEMNPEMNDLKHSKWAHLKILKEKKINALSDKHKSIVKLIAHNSRNRKINNRKYNIVKVVHRSSCKLESCLSMNTTNSTAYKKNSTEDLQNVLNKIIKDFNKTHVNTTESLRKKKRKFSVLRYLKKIFNKIFKHDKPDRLSKHHLVETLCENFGPCRVSRRDRLKLIVKLGELDRETTKILKSVKIIKGLLKLVELPNGADSDASKQQNFNDDIIKLNNILKGNYSFNLTDTQTTQVEYIKKNTEDFITSVRKFAKLLNEIIAILNKEDVKVHKKFDLFLTHKNNAKQNPFQSLRSLLKKYNLVQNSFMKQMYEQLNNFESNIHKKLKVSAVMGVNNSVEIENFSRNIIQNLRKLKHLAQTVSSSARTKRELSRDDDAIEYLLMLMEYLIKQNHPLDAAPVNDGIDLLIEAIKNAPDIKPIKKKVLEYTPATYSETTTYPTTVPITTENTYIEDDHLPDTEKSSSEDKGKMKLEETEVKLDENKELVDMVADDDKDPEENNHYDRRAGPMKMDEVTEMSYFNRLEQNIAEPENLIVTTTPMSMEMDTREKQDSQDDVNMEKTLTIKQNNLDKSAINESRARARARARARSRAGVETVVADTVAGVGVGVEMDVEKATQAAVAAGIGREGRVVTEPEDRAADISDTNEKKFEVFAGDIDEESSTAAPSTEPEPSTTVTTEFYSAPTIRSRTKMKHLNLESYDSDSLDKKSKLEWIEENFGRDVPKDFTDFDESVNATATTIKYVTIKSKEAQVTDKLDVSNLTKEVDEEAEKNKKKTDKLNAEDVMLRKQMDLLNSLDYGTEKGETFESDSKDPNADDRYSSDTFPAYFI